MQSKRASKIESVVQQAVGFIVGIIAQLIVYPLLGLEINFNNVLLIGIIFAIVSGIRNYIVRRAFNYFDKEKDNV